jgi:hypothetical protein
VTSLAVYGDAPYSCKAGEPFINKIATLTVDFGKPVLLINGDSHIYRSDNPLANNAPCAIETGVGTARTSFGPFSWERVIPTPGS